MNNLHMIALAMHNYHDSFRAFPAAANTRPNSPHAHSWRVALLPYLEQAPLYNEYKFDEPWDSESNKKFIAKMPAVFRDANDPPDSTSSSYYVLTGPGTVFPGKKGTGMAEITDGTSNTLLVVEAQRDIPWTKPDDIAYVTDKPLPKLGGHYPEGFLAALCDGGVRLLPHGIDEKTLRHLIRISDGFPVDWNKIAPPGGGVPQGRP